MLEAIIKRLKRDKRGVSNVIVIMLSLILIVIIVANVVLWSYQMNQFDWERTQEKISILDVVPIRESWSCNPSGYTLEGSTSWLSGDVSNLTSDDSVYMTFRSYSSISNETRYMRSSEHTVNGLTTYHLDITQTSSYLEKNSSINGQKPCTWGIRVWKRDSDGIETEITNGSKVATVSRSENGQGMQNNTWNCPQTSLTSTDAIVIRVYVSFAGGGDNLLGEIVTEQLNASQLESATWTVYYWTRRDWNPPFTNAYWRFGDPTHNSRIENFNYRKGNKYTAEVEFTGLSNTEYWIQLNWTLKIAWTVGSVNVTLQLYNYTLDDYSTSGNGYVFYFSDSRPNTDETKSQTINVNPAHFRNATGYWKVKVKGVKATDTQFDLKVDWIEIKPVKDNGTCFTLKNKGSLTSHIVSLWIIYPTVHKRYDLNIFVSSGETLSYFSADVHLLNEQYIVKVVTKRGNIAVYSNT